MGSGGNKNNFLSFDECKKVCQKNILEELIKSFSSEYILKHKVSINCMLFLYLKFLKYNYINY